MSEHENERYAHRNVTLTTLAPRGRGSRGETRGRGERGGRGAERGGWGRGRGGGGERGGRGRGGERGAPRGSEHRGRGRGSSNGGRRGAGVGDSLKQYSPTNKFEIIDIGINLAHRSYDLDRQAVITRAIDNGVKKMIVTGIPFVFILTKQGRRFVQVLRPSILPKKTQEFCLLRLESTRTTQKVCYYQTP